MHEGTGAVMTYFCDAWFVFCCQLLPLGGDFSAEFDGATARLHIHQVYPEDEGEYTCVAYNELGRAITSACLVVDGKKLDELEQSAL